MYIQTINSTTDLALALIKAQWCVVVCPLDVLAGLPLLIHYTASNAVLGVLSVSRAVVLYEVYVEYT
jgi:hypothetical protein